MDYRIILCGTEECGKSCIVLRFYSNTFTELYDPTIEDSYRKQISVDNKDCILEIIDTAGKSEFNGMNDCYIRDTDGFLCVYSITSRKTFDKILAYIHDIYEKKNLENIPIILVGNKCDIENKRQISIKEGEETAENLGISFFETSAKENINITEIFYEITREIDKYKIITKPPKSSKQTKQCILS